LRRWFVQYNYTDYSLTNPTASESYLTCNAHRVPPGFRFLNSSTILVVSLVIVLMQFVLGDVLWIGTAFDTHTGCDQHALILWRPGLTLNTYIF